MNTHVVSIRFFVVYVQYFVVSNHPMFGYPKSPQRGMSYHEFTSPREFAAELFNKSVISIIYHVNGYDQITSIDMIMLPSGKRLHNCGKIHHFSRVNPLFLWPCSIAMFVF